MGNSYKRKQNDTYDVTKFVLAIFVTMIHLISFGRLGNLGKLPFPILRLAVPLFFMLSSYFFFSKLTHTAKEQHDAVLKKSLTRNLYLYLFWLLIMFYEVNAYRGYLGNGILAGIKHLLTDFFLGSTFIASWYIMALMIGLAVIYGLSKIVGNRGLLIFGFVTYVFCVLMSNYGNIGWVRMYIMHPVWSLPVQWVPVNSFPVSFLWIALGKYFADHPKAFYAGRMSTQLWALGFAFVALYAEQLLIIFLKSDYRSDCYFMLIPVCCLLFGLINNVHMKVKGAKILRAFSTITFCLHATLAKVLVTIMVDYGIMQWSFRYSILKWAVTVVLCGVATWGILRLEKVRGFGWLVYSH